MKTLFVSIAVLLGSTALYAQDDNKVPDLPPEPTKITHETNYKYYGNTDKGFSFMADLGIGPAFVPVGTGASMDLNVVFGYRFNEFINIGVGGGLRWYIPCGKTISLPDPATIESNSYVKDMAFPIFASAHGSFIKLDSREMVPFWRFDIGYSIQEGFFFTPAVGMSFGSETRNRFNLSLSYTPQWSHVVDRNQAGVYNSGVVSILQMRFGYEF